MTASRILKLAVIYCFASSPLSRGGTRWSLEESSSRAALKSSKSRMELDDRIGLTFNRGQSQAFGPGGQAMSQSMTVGFQTGIFDPQTNTYVPLENQFNGFSNQFRSGNGAPNAWSASRSSGNFGSLGGQASAGYNGGYGTADVTSHTISHLIPLPDGTVLLSGLKKTPDTSNFDQDVPHKENTDREFNKEYQEMPIETEQLVGFWQSFIEICSLKSNIYIQQS
ncbi:unnamed protein product [Allacma fusca]|uniref:Uncharacterized protein n=1 Tax=Allacma fusca TaxID=39272 RepID=A0A8J2LIL1_9HEXA|nr:unnamed protein product [Allacma fusca]